MDSIAYQFDTPVFTIGPYVFSVGHGLGVVLLVVLIVVFSYRSARVAQTRLQLAEIVKAQVEMQGRIAAMADVFGSRQAELNMVVQDRIDGMSRHLGQTMTEQARTAQQDLRTLQERLAVIDTAQNNIQALARDIVGLQSILSNKQTRGAFGQARMEAIVADALPIGAYEFQPTLSNGNRPDCLVKMPNGQASLVIDAKFPLEAWNAMRDCGPEGVVQAGQRFRRDMDVHIRDIAAKYMIKGETQDTAFLFLPSESIFAELHENFEPVVQKAHKARIVIVSPTLLMLSIQVIQSVLKDQRMRQQAHLIQSEVARLMDDLARLDDRVRKLQSHFVAAQKDVEMIVTSADKVARRGERIEAMEFETVATPEDLPASAQSRAAPGRTGQLRFTVVDED